jgi:hypothetical protein
MDRRQPKRRKISHSNIYTYDTLPDVQGHFRYLVLKPGTGDEPLACDIHTARIDNVDYEAISYVWGSEEKPKTLQCGKKSIPITVNLYAAIARLRLPGQERVLWADSVCINQDDLEEKGHQVAQVGSIYRQASHVLICLGADDGGHALRASTIIDEVAKMIQTAKVDPSDWNTFPWPDLDSELLNNRRLDSLAILLQQNWFKRGWVVREAAFAQKATVIWGSVEFAWAHLMETLVWISSRSTSVFRGIEIVPWLHVSAYEMRCPQLTRVFWGETSEPTTSLLYYMHLGRRLGLKDARDRVYAFLDLTADSNSLAIIPDYSAPPLEVYWNFAIHCLQSTNDLGHLIYVLHDEQSLISGVPSWVPRWDIRTAAIIKEQWRSRKMSRNREAFAPKLITRDTLEVRGICYDCIAAASDVLRYATTTPLMLVSIWQSFSAPHGGLVYEGDRQVEAFISVLTRGMRAGDAATWDQERKEWIGAFNPAIEADSERRSATERLTSIESLEQSTFYQLLRNLTHGYRAIVTDHGYFGVAPAVAAVGDTCAIIFGSKSTCILRSTDQAEHYKFLGSSFVLGRYWENSDLEFGSENNRDWVDWGVEEQDIFLR